MSKSSSKLINFKASSHPDRRSTSQLLPTDRAPPLDMPFDWPFSSIRFMQRLLFPHLLDVGLQVSPLGVSWLTSKLWSPLRESGLSNDVSDRFHHASYPSGSSPSRFMEDAVSSSSASSVLLFGQWVFNSRQCVGRRWWFVTAQIKMLSECPFLFSYLIIYSYSAFTVQSCPRTMSNFYYTPTTNEVTKNFKNT